MEDKQDLEKLLTKAGFEVIIAEGEADVYIGAHALAQDIIISADSEMAFYEGVQTLAMPKFTRGGYISQLVKKKLSGACLEPFALPVLGIVSGNDYVPNVPGLAIRKNVELLKQLQTHQRTSKELLDAYVIATDADSLGYNFTSAYNVFLEFNEGHNINVDVDDPMDRLDIIERIDRAREQMYILDISDNRHSLHTRGVINTTSVVMTTVTTPLKDGAMKKNKLGGTWDANR
ncbi:hypothetical protein SeLEV6574_g07740 [Synchytrium endobioticum]|uniref:XPG-I domain-containing protein n=1 Tax=Synchytrium endobioticum TaxID=286115 RepID=A0A507CBX5_9FUNG|nr:hypothetical protein SeLEV6574_g07740 [Synchytrium endobioticum]